MTKQERNVYRTLIFFAAAAILVSMVAGPLRHTAVAIGAAVAAMIVSVCLIVYGLIFWNKP